MRDLVLALVVATTLAAGGNTDRKVQVTNLPPPTRNVELVTPVQTPKQQSAELQRILR